jgi:hypothetical protein
LKWLLGTIEVLLLWDAMAEDEFAMLDALGVAAVPLLEPDDCGLYGGGMTISSSLPSVTISTSVAMGKSS